MRLFSAKIIKNQKVIGGCAAKLRYYAALTILVNSSVGICQEIISASSKVFTQSPSETLPQGTEIILRLNSPLTTKNHGVRKGEKFYLTTVFDIYRNNKLLIPQGTPAIGEVTWTTGRSVFGKSGKMAVRMRYIDLRGRQIPLSGLYRKNGSTNVVGTVAATLVTTGGLGGFLVTGKSAEFPAGYNFTAVTVNNESF